MFELFKSPQTQLQAHFQIQREREKHCWWPWNGKDNHTAVTGRELCRENEHVQHSSAAAQMLEEKDNGCDVQGQEQQDTEVTLDPRSQPAGTTPSVEIAHLPEPAGWKAEPACRERPG